MLVWKLVHYILQYMCMNFIMRHFSKKIQAPIKSYSIIKL